MHLGSIIISGKTFTGSVLEISNNTVIVDGMIINSSDDKKLVIEKIEGPFDSFTCERSIEMPNGNITATNIKVAGSIYCSNIRGDVDAGGSVHCGNVSGSVDAGGSIKSSVI